MKIGATAIAVNGASPADRRLSRIAAIIECVDNRCMAADGRVTPTLQEMTQAEISEIYRLASGTGESTVFNAMDREALADAMGMLQGKLSHTGELTAEDLATALDHAGITGLFHDGTRADRHCAGNDPFARIES